MKRFHRPEVVHEVREAAAWYEERQASLGEAYVASIRRTLLEIDSHPERFPVVHQDIRRVLTPKPFPYQIFYFVDHERDRIVVLAITHQARHESTWKARR